MSEYLSDTELYFSSEAAPNDRQIILADEEYHHAVKVMRIKAGESINITNGNGVLFKCTVSEVSSRHLIAEVDVIKTFENRLSDVTFCLPVLKNPDRFKFALEKCTELGITDFILFNSTRSVAKVRNTGKWNRTLLSAMKQSLRVFLPRIAMLDDFRELLSLKGEMFVFDQNGTSRFEHHQWRELKGFFIFGPEGGLSDEELALFDKVYQLSNNRLRTETAVIKCASLLSL